MSLQEYRRKRNFEKTSEPGAEKPPRANRHRFVVQKHAASRLHYDFRLELDGTLKSWAVPKGMPFTRGEKHLAIQVEDHPLSYIDFEGTIPQGQYGGGTVMVWDLGTYEPLSASPAKDLADGKLHFKLAGRKLKGEWHLVRLHDSDQWLLIRAEDDLRPVSKQLEDTSALSGKNMQALAAGTSVWPSDRQMEKPSLAKVHKKKRGRQSALKFVQPMNARLVASPPAGDWIYEVKWDGYRALALKQNEKVQLFSRNEKDFDSQFPEISAAVRQIDALDAFIDGEIVALDPEGRSSFQRLQDHQLSKERPPIFYYAFDLLQLNGRDLRHEPLELRKALLQNILPKTGGVIRYSGSLAGPIPKLLKRVQRLGLEGLIGKRKGSVYEAGKRTGAWIKLKLLHEQEFIIGGYTEPSGSRHHFGALLVGYHAKKGLQFAGKVGTGYNETMLHELRQKFDRLSAAKCPFENLPEKSGSHYGQGITAPAMERCHWIKPVLVGQIKFSEWTRDGKLRQPVFLGLREDKNAREVAREIPA